MISIKQGDCLELMKEIKDNSIDMILLYRIHHLVKKIM